MATLVQKFILATAVVASAGALSPAHAGTLQSATIGGSNASDYLIYGSNATSTFLVPNNPANLTSALSGNSSSPTGNVELAASSEKAGFDFTKNTTLNGTIGGKTISISSLTKSDWLSPVNGTTFGQSWFNQALTSNNVSLDSTVKASLFSIFQSSGGFERFSDPNISYVNQNDTTGQISIGLAGHYNANSLFQFTQLIDTYLSQTKSLSLAKQKALAPVIQQLTDLKPTLTTAKIQASEVFKYTYNGQTNYGYSFLATKSGLVEKSDGISHNGNYEVVFQGIAPPKKVPEPTMVLSLLGLAGVAAVRRRKGQTTE
jgi:hypothetical protein